MGRLNKSLFGTAFNEAVAAKIAARIVQLKTRMALWLSKIDQRLSNTQKKIVLICYLLLFGGYLLLIAVKAITVKSAPVQIPHSKVHPLVPKRDDTVHINQQQ